MKKGCNGNKLSLSEQEQEQEQEKNSEKKNGHNVTRNEEDEDDEFSVESLIANLNEMRSKASQMSFEERKQYAEKVVAGFWKSIGGDASELVNFDDDDDDDDDGGNGDDKLHD